MQTLKVLKFARFDSFAFTMVCKRIEHLQAKFRARIEWDNSFKDRLLELVRRIEVIWQPRVKKVLSSCSYKMVASPLALWEGFLLSRSINIDRCLDRRTNSFAECLASRRRVNNLVQWAFREQGFSISFFQKTQVVRRRNVNLLS